VPAADLAGATAGTAGDAAQPAEATVPTPTPPDLAGSGVSTGITVYGHWVIDVRNRDGSLAAHRDVENSLASTGGELLNQILSGQMVPGALGIWLCELPKGFTNPTVDACNNYGANTLIIQPKGSHFTLSACTSDIGCYPTLSAPAIGGYPTFGLTLTSTVTDAPATTIDTVQSAVYVCGTSADGVGLVGPNSAYTPSSCFKSSSTAGGGAGNFVQVQQLTGTSIVPVTVTAGQAINVKFTLSFGSASTVK
jgi:hypothetical protein